MSLIFKTIYISISCLFLLILTILTQPWRLFVYIVAKVLRPELDSFAIGITRLFCSTVKWGSILPTNTIVVLTVDADVELEAFRTSFCQRVLEKRDPKGKLMFQKFYQTITHFMGYPFWTREKHFDIKNHIVAYDYKLDGIDCFDENRLKKYLPKILNQPWQNGRSYWNITLVHGYNKNNKTLIIMKWQHVLGDGFSMKNVLETLFLHENIPEAERTNQLLPKLNLHEKSLLHKYVRTLLQSLKAILLFPYESARFKEGTTGNEINLWQKDAIANEYLLTFTKPFRVEAIKSAQGKFTVGFQTILFSVMSSALEKALKQCHQPITKELLADYSKPVIPHPGGMTNSLYFGQICAPLMATSIEERLLQTERSFRAHKVSNIPLGLYYVMELAGRLPGSLPWMLVAFIFQFVHIIFTSFPYFGELSFEGNAVSDMFALFSTPHRSADLAVIVTGSPNQVRFGLSLRKNVTSLPATFIHIVCDYIEEEMEKWCKSVKT